MGSVWKNGDVSEFHGSSIPQCNGKEDRCATRKVVKSQCRTEEMEPGKFIRKCEKTEQIFKDCVGRCLMVLEKILDDMLELDSRTRPTEMVQSTEEYTEEDVTDNIVKGSFPLESADHGPLHFPGLRSDIEAIERNFFGSINQFFEAAEEMKNEFFSSLGVPHIYDDNSSSLHKKHGIHIESRPPNKDLPKKISDGDVDLSGLAEDV